VGIGLGLRVFSRPYDNRGTRRGEVFRGVCKGALGWWGSGERKANLILQSDTVCHFLSRLVLTQADGEIEKPL